MKRMVTIIMMAFMMLGLTACGAADNAGTQKEITDVAVYEDTQANILSADFYDLEDGTSVVRVHFRFTNNQADGLYMYECFSVRAFQNDTQLDDLTNVNEDAETGDSAELIREVKNGASLEGSYVFKLSGNSDVEVNVCTPTADENLLAKKVFNFEKESAKADTEGDYESTEESLNWISTEDKFEDMLDAYQGTWTNGRSNTVVVDGNAIYSVWYNVNNPDEVSDIKTFFFDLDENSSLVIVNQYGQICQIPSIDENGRFIQEPTTGGKTSEFEYVSADKTVPVEKADPEIGMSELEIYSSKWGYPDKKNVTDTEYSHREQWVYDGKGYIYFKDGYVTSIQKK